MTLDWGAHIGFGAALAGAALLAFGCRCAEEPAPGGASPSSAASSRASAPGSPAPRTLYLPDAAGEGTRAAALPSVAATRVTIAKRCPDDMVDVRGEFCIDRFEASLFDLDSGQRFSPYYHPSAGQTRRSYDRWTRLAPQIGPQPARAVPVPLPPEWQLAGSPRPVARAERGVVPQGYVSRVVASEACRAAGKRLCSSEEWATACRGHQRRRFPYGDRYAPGACNVFRESHPAAVLHGNASEGHLDPRLNRVHEGDDPLLRPTGATSECRSEWGAEAIYDMVGNLDEWVSDAGGVFVGGFFSRATREGCDARIEAHPPEYFDYSLGVRCCR